MNSAKHQPAVAGLSLFVVVVGIYFLTYSGAPITNDENYLFDSTTGLVRRGDLRPTYMYDLRPFTGSSGVPWLEVTHEPLQPILAAPLLWLAQHLPAIGMMHTVWLLNILVTALTAVVLFACALQSGYSLRVAWFGALLYGIGTNAWPYGRTFFREPLVGLFTLICFSCAWAAQRSLWGDGKAARRARFWLLCLVASFWAAVLTKAVSLILLPALIVVLLPNRERLFRHRRAVAAGLAIGIVLIVAGIMLMNALGIGGARFSIPVWLYNLRGAKGQDALQSLIGYQISPGRSVWLYSPVLLLGFPGAYLLVWRGQWRLVAGPALALALVSLSYGFTLGGEWLGGIGWGPRYLIPLVPLLMFWVFPALDWLGQPGRAKTWQAGAALLVALGVGVQLLGVLVPISWYYERIGQAGVPLWQEATWTWQWSPIAQTLALLDLKSLDIAWLSRADPGWLPVVLALLLAGLGTLLSKFHATRRLPSAALLRAGFIMSTAAIVIVLGTGLYCLRADPRYTNRREDVLELINELQTRVNSNDAVFIDNKDFQPAFMNYFKSSALVMTLPYAPGERPSPDAVPAVTSENPADLLGAGAAYAMDWAAQRYDRLWLATGYGPFVTFAVRPTERYLVEHYFPISRLEPSQLARAISFLPVRSQANNGQPTEFHFGDSLALRRYDLPKGKMYRAGQVVPISLVWQPLRRLSVDYNVSLQIIGLDGTPKVQRDGPFQDTFGLTSRWQPDRQYQDNHGLQLPATLPSGRYWLQVVVYTWQDGKRLPVMTADGQPLGDALRLVEMVVP